VRLVFLARFGAAGTAEKEIDAAFDVGVFVALEM
jgi:hypothetical protein